MRRCGKYLTHCFKSVYRTKHDKYVNVVYFLLQFPCPYGKIVSIINEAASEFVEIMAKNDQYSGEFFEQEISGRGDV